MTKYQVGQFPNLERHLSLFQPFSCYVDFFSVTLSFSPDLFLYLTLFILTPSHSSYLPSSDFISLSTCTSFLLFLASPSHPLFISFLPHTLVILHLHSWTARLNDHTVSLPNDFHYSSRCGNVSESISLLLVYISQLLDGLLDCLLCPIVWFMTIYLQNL